MPNSSPKKTYYRWWVMSFIFAIYTIANADRANIGFALPYIQKEFELSNTMAGLLVSIFFLGYSLNQIPSGMLISKIGVRKVYAGGMFFTSIFTFFMGIIDSIWAIKICRLFVGVAEAPVAVGSSVTINNWFPSKEKGTAAGIYLASSKVGPLIVPPLCAWIIMHFSWHYIFIFFAFPGLIGAIFWYVMVHNKPHESPFVSQAEIDYIHQDDNKVKSETQKSIIPPIQFKRTWIDSIIRTKPTKTLTTTRQVFRCWDIYGVAVGYFFMVGTVSVLMAWLPKYLLEERHFAIMSSAFLSSSPFLGTIFGNFLGGFLSDNIFKKRRKPLMIVSAASTSLTMYSLVYAPENMYLLGGLLFITGFLLSLGYSAFIVYPMGRANKASYPTAFAIINMGGQLGGMCAPFFVGIILDYFSWSAVFTTLAIGSLFCLGLVLSVIEPEPTY
ncbi:MFS transporter [Orbus wheelerorum]|uniref:MFS transporter n=1 Tax=Orbus wheelerorum TaxID=3074111 RepID=UPI00370D61E5